MKILLLLSLLLSSAAPARQGPTPTGGTPLVVLGFKWSKSRQVLKLPETSAAAAPAAAMTAADKNFQRSRRINDPAGVRDPNAD
ncbi:MAG TPA: hypothetical protein VGV38_16530, partial [Pyrinomonadaceae bacterium]|nr:hypothetical protein [Pyrinomonadaceae bacterium]